MKPRFLVFRVADADSLFLGACPEGADDSENVDLIFCQCQDDLAEFCAWNIDAGDCPVGLAADAGKLEPQVDQNFANSKHTLSVAFIGVMKISSSEKKRGVCRVFPHLLRIVSRDLNQILIC